LVFADFGTYAVALTEPGDFQQSGDATSTSNRRRPTTLLGVRSGNDEEGGESEKDTRNHRGGIAAFALAIPAGPAFAVSPSQQECEAQGGTFDRSGGQVSCVIVEEGKNPKFTDTETTTGQGNIGNKEEQQQACEPTGSGKCPPGQF